MSTYPAFRISYQTSEAAARAAHKHLQDLVQRIRTADTLAEVQRFVGPSEEERAQNNARATALHNLWEQADRNAWGHDPEKWPEKEAALHRLLNFQQGEYERKYL